MDQGLMGGVGGGVGEPSSSGGSHSLAQRAEGEGSGWPVKTQY